MSKEVKINLMVAFYTGLKVLICAMRVFLSIEMIRSFTNLVVALQLINQMCDLGFFQYLKQHSREQNLTRKWTTADLCDVKKNFVAVKAEKTKFPK